ncbi:hypothetical protein HDF16_001828 [Granulicella aggregans]|uniref:Protein-glutamine gamma-glutamyltransferase-like C-terminal domain-containing protein n=1 Tax=Granulicella aggregans TaxID=474949 RepID=A0A7W7ZC70_9BACT|nr:hypothetical protein [Granulicella aggregans]
MRAQTPSTLTVGQPADRPAAKPLDGYRAHLIALRELVGACEHSPAACDPAKAGSNDRIPPHDDKPAFDVRWSWLWDLMLKAKDAKLADRTALLQQAEARLGDQLREAGVDTGQGVAHDPGTNFKQARRDADSILAGSEFKHVTGNGIWEQLSAKLINWLGRIFGGVSNLGQRAPWLGPVIMYGFLLLALAGLLVWVLRMLDRQRMAVRLQHPAAITASQETAKVWASLAEQAAAAEDWREAIHALYWATVTELEGRRLWRQNSVRTPREYLRLVPPDAPQHRPLRAFTQQLERIWYGLDPAARADYEQARAVYDELRSS